MNKIFSIIFILLLYNVNFSQEYFQSDKEDSLFINYVSGTWKIYDYFLADISTWGNEEAQKLVNQDFDINKTSFVGLNMYGKNLKFQMRELTAEDYFNEYNSMVRFPLVKNEYLVIIEVEFSADDVAKLSLDVVLLKDYSILIPWNGVFFKLYKL